MFTKEEFENILFPEMQRRPIVTDRYLSSFSDGALPFNAYLLSDWALDSVSNEFPGSHGCEQVIERKERVQRHLARLIREESSQ